MSAQASAPDRSAVAALLGSLRARGVDLWIREETGQIILEPAELLSEHDLAVLREVKPVAIELLRSELAGTPRDADEPPRWVRTDNPGRAPLCNTSGCKLKDYPMFRTVSKIPAWICPACLASCNVAKGAPR